jgi:GTP diphosphokinase / guanosine-3',5'-bis(diphosphate) 3'-diphosphatase
MDWLHFNQKLTNLGYSEADRSFIERAFQFAKNAHGEQKRASGEPYINHATAVGMIVADMKLDAETIAAAILHDTIEDCGISHEQLTEKFGKHTAFLVEGVSKLGNIRYSEAQRKVESLRKMFLAVAEDIRVVLIKLADRLHNMRTIQYVQKEKQQRIATETLEIYAPLAYRLGMGSIKGELEDLAFPVVQPKEYAWTKHLAEEWIPRGEQYLRDEVKPTLQEMLLLEGIEPVSIDFRKKHLYSLWKKLLRYDMDIARITDLLAIRVIVRTVEDCYQTFGIIHQLWKPLPGRIKDYIALPKANGYRSLHTTVFCIGSKIMEFQIRTEEMHAEAERGVAAHWAYAEKNKPKPGSIVDPHMKWVHKLSEWQKDYDPAEQGDEFLESLTIDFFRDRTFVLTPKGEVIDLPAGATPVDFAYAVHTDIGNHMTGAKINGKLAPFDRELANGETVEILTQKNRKPNAEWLSFVKASLTRNRIRAALRKTTEPTTLRHPEQMRRAGSKVPYQFTVTVQDRVGLLKDITAVFSAHRVSIRHVAINDKNRSHPDIVLTTELRDKKQAESIVARLKNIRYVEEIAFRLITKP